MKINTKRTQNRHRTKFFLRSKSHSDIFLFIQKQTTNKNFFYGKASSDKKILYAKPQTDNYIYLAIRLLSAICTKLIIWQKRSWFSYFTEKQFLESAEIESCKSLVMLNAVRIASITKISR